MISIEEAQSWVGRTAVDNSGQQIGFVTQIWVDDTSGDPEWASVKVIGLRGREALVPLAGAAPFGGGRRFAYSKEDIVDAPEAARDGTLPAEEKDQLVTYYGAPDTDPLPGSTTWVQRLEGAADGANIREIAALQGSAAPARAPEAPAHEASIPEAVTPQAPVERKTGRRFGRKATQSAS